MQEEGIIKGRDDVQEDRRKGWDHAEGQYKRGGV